MSWRELKVNKDLQGSLCPLRKQHCVGAACAWWEPNQKACSLLVVCSLLDELNANLEEARNNAANVVLRCLRDLTSTKNWWRFGEAPLREMIS